MKRIVLALVAIFLVAPMAFAEPGPEVIYVNDDTGECGYLWVGDEYEEYTPESRAWDEVMLLGETRENVCADVEGKYGSEICGSSDAEAICSDLGYEYIGEVPSETKILMEEDGAIDDDQQPWVLYAVGGILVILGVIFVRNRS